MKGFAIIGVVWGHCTSFESMVHFLNQWHLAVFFFFVSGYLFKGYGKDDNVRILVNSKFGKYIAIVGDYSFLLCFFIFFHLKL